ncbi:BglG family transcription antiterminator [Virgibacillus halodenitrificans]|uniref:BglG family transcription antiterminator n=1 Tax=Virgibacillus halodenitrificans TaxID=1482 RepID=UPI000367547E|nr:BglG family transcription antiterminator [Virgibacillus halodenitrificans]
MGKLYIASRERKLLSILLDARGEVKVKELAKLLNISERTAHRDLNQVETTVAKFNLQLNRKQGIGIKLSGQEENNLRLQATIASLEQTDYTIEERHAIIFLILFEADEPVKLFTFASELNVTNATISNDLDQMEEHLNKYGLRLYRKRGLGVELEGTEAAKRKAISSFIADFIDPYEYLTMAKETLNKHSSFPQNSISNRLLGLVNPEKLERIEEEVQQVVGKLLPHLADSAYIALVVHLALAVQRLEKGDHIKFDPTYLEEIRTTKEFGIARQLIRGLEQRLNLHIPNDEIGYITMHLMGAKLRVEQNYMIEDSSMDTAYIAKELISYISHRLHVDLTENFSLLNDLVTHLKPAVYRIKQGMNIKNPMLEDIVTDYEDLFELIKEAVTELFPEVHFPDDEIGYLVLHFASALLSGEWKVDLRALVICSSGIGTAKILASRLMQKIPEIKQVDNRSMFEVADVKADYDLIVSTIPLKEDENDYILVSPMLQQDEVERIKRWVRKQKLQKINKKKPQQEEGEQSNAYTEKLTIMQKYSGITIRILDAFRITYLSAKASLIHVLEKACKQLADEKVITDEKKIVQKLMEREQISGLGIPDTSLALYHTRDDGIDKSSFTIYDLKEPIVLMGMDGKEQAISRVLLMLAPKEIEQESLEVLSFLSSLLIQGDSITRLFESGKETEIREYLSEQFFNFIQQKA